MFIFDKKKQVYSRVAKKKNVVKSIFWIIFQKNTKFSQIFSKLKFSYLPDLFVLGCQLVNWASKTQINIPEVFCRGFEANCYQLYIWYYICLGVDINQLPNLHKKSQKKKL